MRPALRLSSLSRHLVNFNPTTSNVTRTMSTSTSPSSAAPAIIAGVGPGTGASVARKFAERYPVFLLARNPANYEPLVEEIKNNGGWAQGISTDISDAGSVEKAFAEIKKYSGKEEPRASAAVFNVGGKFIRKSFLDLSQEEFEAGFEANGRGAYLFSRAVLPLLLASTTSSYSTPEYPPTLIFTGATASMKGSALCSSFATGKFALRALAQSLGREFGPKGVHVAHVVVDGVIDIERTKGWEVGGVDGKISPGAIADSYWYLHTQPRTTFTHEIDIRPYIEKW